VTDSDTGLPAEGETVTFERTFTNGDVERFVEVSEDRGDHHLEPDTEGRLLVHGLLTATLPTKVGGRYDVLASRMEFEFRRPVWTDETVRCAVTFTRVEREERDGDTARTRVEAEFDCTREGETVLAGRFEGVVRDPPPA
jgi:acyl dehydratase